MAARVLTDDERRTLVECLSWLAGGAFIEHETGDLYEDVLLAFSADHPGKVVQANPLTDFLAWMDGGDRIHRDGPPNPHGENLSFYHSDYSGTEDRYSWQVAAEDMVGLYESGEV
jgi:hypothetical protein